MLVSFSTHAHDDLIRANLAVRSHPQSLGPWSALSHLPLWLRFYLFQSCHRHTPLLFLPLSAFPVFLLISPQSAFLQQAVGFSPATSILRLTAVVAHKAGTLHCDVARCPTAALHNPVWGLCWLDWPVFTQAPGARYDPAAAALRGRLAVYSITHRRALEEEFVLLAAKKPCGTFFFFYSWSVRLYCKLHSWT